MTRVATFIDEASAFKLSTAFREEMYFRIREAEKKEDKPNLLTDNHTLYYTAFAIGYHFDNNPKEVLKSSIAFINVNAINREIAELMVRLVLKRKPEIDDSRELWSEIEKYAECGIQILYDNWKENKMVDVSEILE